LIVEGEEYEDLAMSNVFDTIEPPKKMNNNSDMDLAMQLQMKEQELANRNWGRKNRRMIKNVNMDPMEELNVNFKGINIRQKQNPRSHIEKLRDEHYVNPLKSYKNLMTKKKLDFDGKNDSEGKGKKKEDWKDYKGW